MSNDQSHLGGLASVCRQAHCNAQILKYVEVLQQLSRCLGGEPIWGTSQCGRRCSCAGGLLAAPVAPSRPGTPTCTMQQHQRPVQHKPGGKLHACGCSTQGQGLGRTPQQPDHGPAFLQVGSRACGGNAWATTTFGWRWAGRMHGHQATAPTSLLGVGQAGGSSIRGSEGACLLHRPLAAHMALQVLHFDLCHMPGWCCTLAQRLVTGAVPRHLNYATSLKHSPCCHNFPQPGN